MAGYILVDHVKKIYNSGKDAVEAVSGVSFVANKGEFIAILGPSGCGKSTLLMMCGGLEPTSAGTITIDGQQVTGPRANVGVMFQDSTLLPWKTVLENILFPVKIQRRPLAQYRERALQLIEMVGLHGFADMKPHQLSGGMRQRVALARTLCTNPDIVLLDEPFSALDSQTRLALADEIGEILRREAKTVILVTHDIGEAISMAERVIVLSRRPGQVKSNHAIRFASADAGRLAPLAARNAPEFNDYFRTLWQELDVHVDH